MGTWVSIANHLDAIRFAPALRCQLIGILATASCQIQWFPGASNEQRPIPRHPLRNLCSSACDQAAITVNTSLPHQSSTSITAIITTSSPSDALAGRLPFASANVSSSESNCIVLRRLLLGVVLLSSLLLIFRHFLVRWPVSGHESPFALKASCTSADEPSNRSSHGTHVIYAMGGPNSPMSHGNRSNSAPV
ncbi:hypothetical protein CH063_08491 [Colletotrichum higginsianum]|uniref:Uncharacterized protein n=1 Tax=Colletotrichum higginsianum (strain IMI 349063) TaxID=759273 RepID=H1VA13_COLHI|nr:hypothetical protein CH063_08491 [Colletotrichum higginsianum]